MLIQVHASCNYDKIQYVAIRVPKLLSLLLYLYYSVCKMKKNKDTNTDLIELQRKQGNKMT